MAKYLKPRRGSKNNAIAQKIKLLKGEFFMEFPNGEIGRESGRIVVGDGATSYDSIDYTSTATNKFKPFITDPSIYVPRFVNTATSAGSGPAMEDIKEMGDGSTSTTKILPDIIGTVKKVLVYHANSITQLNNDLAGKAAIDHTHDAFTSTSSGFVPNPTTVNVNKFLKGDGTWSSPNDTTYTNATTATRGLAPIVNIPASHSSADDIANICLRANSEGKAAWGELGLATTVSRGAVPHLNGATSERYLLYSHANTVNWTKHPNDFIFSNASTGSLPQNSGTSIKRVGDSSSFVIPESGTYLIMGSVSMACSDMTPFISTNPYNPYIGRTEFYIAHNNHPGDDDTHLLTRVSVQSSDHYQQWFCMPISLNATTYYHYITTEYNQDPHLEFSSNVWIVRFNGRSIANF